VNPQEAVMEHPFEEGTPPGVLIRDFAIFQLKTALDGIKDAIVFPLAIIVMVLDLVFVRGPRRGRTFYQLMSVCESFDRWLNLYGAARKARGHREGLFGGSEPGDGTMLGDLEEMARRGDPPRRPSIGGA
jgi:hypothetical protein